MDELSRDLDKAERWFNRIPGMQPEYIEALITEGFFSYTDLTFLEAEQLAEIIGIDPEVADDMIIFAEDEAERIEREGEPEEEVQPAGGRRGRRPSRRPRARSSEEAAALAEGEVPAEAIPADGAAPAGGFESLFQPEGEAAAEPGGRRRLQAEHRQRSRPSSGIPRPKNRPKDEADEPAKGGIRWSNRGPDRVCRPAARTAAYCRMSLSLSSGRRSNPPGIPNSFPRPASRVPPTPSHSDFLPVRPVCGPECVQVARDGRPGGYPSRVG